MQKHASNVGTDGAQGPSQVKRGPFRFTPRLQGLRLQRRSICQRMHEETYARDARACVCPQGVKTTCPSSKTKTRGRERHNERSGRPLRDHLRAHWTRGHQGRKSKRQRPSPRIDWALPRRSPKRAMICKFGRRTTRLLSGNAAKSARRRGTALPGTRPARVTKSK